MEAKELTGAHRPASVRNGGAVHACAHMPDGKLDRAHQNKSGEPKINRFKVNKQASSAQEQKVS